MDFKKLAKSERLRYFDSPTVVVEKFLEGENNPILRKLRSGKDGLINNVRLCLFKGEDVSFTVFGGDVSYMLSAEDCDKLFDMIESEDQFYALSNNIRKNISNTLDGEE